MEGRREKQGVGYSIREEGIEEPGTGAVGDNGERDPSIVRTQYDDDGRQSHGAVVPDYNKFCQNVSTKCKNIN